MQLHALPLLSFKIIPISTMIVIVATITITISPRAGVVGSVFAEVGVVVVGVDIVSEDVVELVTSSKPYMIQLSVIKSHRLGQEVTTWSDTRSTAVRTWETASVTSSSLRAVCADVISLFMLALRSEGIPPVSASSGSELMTFFISLNASCRSSISTGKASDRWVAKAATTLFPTVS